MPLCVHALGITVVVAPLRAVCGTFGGTCSSQSAYRESGSGAHGCAPAAAYGGTYCSPYHCADRGTLHAAIAGGLGGRRSADLRTGKLPALEVVGAELVEALAAARQHHYAGTRWHGSACADQ